MPGMDGSALAEEIRSLRPETKILYMTGCSGMFIRADMLSPSVSLIRKPFTPADLGRKIRKRAVLEKKHETPATHIVVPGINVVRPEHSHDTSAKREDRLTCLQAYCSSGLRIIRIRKPGTIPPTTCRSRFVVPTSRRAGSRTTRTRTAVMKITE